VVSFFESVLADHSKDHPVAVAYVSATRSPGSVHHSAGRHSATNDYIQRCTEEGLSRPRSCAASSACPLSGEVRARATAVAARARTASEGEAAARRHEPPPLPL